MTLGDRMSAWAATEPSVLALVLIGSQTRAITDEVWRADAQSDWDFQIITSRPNLFEDSAWTKALGCPLSAYAVRRAAIGGVPKVAALFAETEADFVIVPASKMKLWRRSVSRGLHRDSPILQRKLQDLAVVIRPGWHFLKGAEGWDAFYRQVVADIADPRLSDAGVRELADNFVCDAVWTVRKINRGEYLAAQRMLHRSLAETNFRLLHELKLRRGERSFPEIRRAEKILTESELADVRVSATPDAHSLREAVEKASASLREKVQALIGDAWQWPALSS